MIDHILRTSQNRITDVSKEFYDLVIHFECSGNIENYLNAYLDTGGVPTIGIGTISYPNGIRVKIGDKCTIEEANQYFRHELNKVIENVDASTRDDISQGMFNSLVDFGYNTGKTKGTSLHKFISLNPNNFPEIEKEFMKWKYDNGKIISGLIRRRKCEFYLYKNGVNHPTFFL